MEQIIYSKYSNNRNDEFALTTEILVDEQGNKSVRKKADKDAGISHIMSFPNKYKSLSDLYENSHIEIISCDLREDEVYFPFIEGRTVDELIDERIEKGDIEAANQMILEVLHEIANVQKKEKFSVCKNFQDYFGEVDLPHTLEAASGLDIDMVFSNIICEEKDNRKYVIDYEWTFSFLIPINYWLFRCINCYVEQNTKRSILNQEHLFEQLGITSEEIEQYKKMEIYFQQKVYACDVSETRLLGSKEQRDLLCEYERLKNKVQQLERECRLQRRNYNVIRHELKKNKENQQKLEQETNKSFIWRFRKKAYNLLKLLKRKFSQSKESIKREDVFDQLPHANSINGTIAVHLHMYYRDLLEEMLSYIDRIPFAFDLYISCQEMHDPEEIEGVARGLLSYVDKVCVKRFPNRGRDIAPLFVGFGNEIQQYDYFLHIHTKKSPHLGGDGYGWRQYSMTSLLGDDDTTRRNLYLLQQPNIGLVYPEFFVDLSKEACAWMYNEEKGMRFLRKLGIVEAPKVFQYPAGSFYWAKTEALKPLFDMRLQLSDFDEEKGQVDNTLAHVLERATGIVAMDQGYVGAIIDLGDNRARYRISWRMFEDYETYSKDIVRDMLKPFDVVSFGLEDLLITSELYLQRHMFLKLAEDWKELFDASFIKVREEIELSLRTKPSKAVTDVEIYREMAKIYHLTDEQWTEMLQAERELFVKHAIVRGDVVEIYRMQRENGKKVCIATDSIYPRDVIEKVLDKCGICKPAGLFLANEVGVDKTSTEFWDEVLSSFESEKFIHVGADMYHDTQALAVMGKPAIYLMRPQDEFYMSNFYEKFGNQQINSYEESLELGRMVNGRMFNSPFVKVEMEEGERI